MSKEQVLKEMFEIVHTMFTEGWTRDKENKLWALASDNDIFMCEHANDDYEVDGFYIEDDYYLYENMKEYNLYGNM